ncbi:MAG: DUF1016 domain-containing protein [Bacteroidetes bacterium]|nr:MAG: DUF1016 domain-containing protein [Bacteroidota bacterium]
MGNLDKDFIIELKSAILQSRYIAAKIVNKELIGLYFNIGKRINTKTKEQNWGSKVLEQISNKLQNELPGLKGFSSGNLKKMKVFAGFWDLLIPDNTLIGSAVPKQLRKPNYQDNAISSTLSNQLQKSSNQNNAIGSTLSNQFYKSFSSVGFSQHYLIASKSKSIDEALFYIQKTVSEFWSFRILEKHFKNDLFKKQGSLPNNFGITLQPIDANKAIQVFKDEYLLDFVNIEDPDEADEKLIENEIVRNIKKFIQALGSDFAFIGNQYRIIVEDREFFIDLLFFNRKLQALIAFDLKKGEFKPEHLGKMNFYLSALDDLVKQPHENPSIGIILCKEKNNKFVEYSFRDFNKSMGVATYKTSKEIPKQFKNILPDAKTLKKLME